MICRKIKIRNAFWLSIIIFPTLTATIKAEPLRNPGFSCSGSLDPAASVICGDDDLSRANLELIQAYYAIRGASDQSKWAEYKQTAVEFLRTELRRCEIPAKGSVPSDKLWAVKSCLLGELRSQRAYWVDKIKQLGNSTALEEVLRDVSDNIKLQQALKDKGWLPPESEVDGVFGEVTRGAIRNLQIKVGISPDGLLSMATSNFLATEAVISQGPVTTIMPSIVIRGILNNKINQCDVFAASPYDPLKLTTGVDFERLSSNAINICQDEMNRDTQNYTDKKNVRLWFEYARTLQHEENYALAFSWFTKAAEQGYPIAMHALGAAYLSGKGASQDHKLGFAWLKRAADAGVYISNAYTGLMYYQGEFVVRDLYKARYYLNKGIEGGILEIEGVRANDLYIKINEDISTLEVQTVFNQRKLEAAKSCDDFCQLLNSSMSADLNGDKALFWSNNPTKNGEYILYGIGQNPKTPVIVAGRVLSSSLVPSEVTVNQDFRGLNIDIGSVRGLRCDGCDARIVKSNWLKYFLMRMSSGEVR